ncbi:acyltransferase family protein [Steroidobacter sp.]|uniref:acyltransferase family protein n=1 Tax=Steroidobacter sp. TaxID=1978227 RepID=UPI001A39A082|nr:acyltransferase [Steroidobacter sp.]MBL8267456.1 acyltransferase [Steroidobacter sp.]
MSIANGKVADGHAMSEMASAYLDALRATGANLVIAAHVIALYLGMSDPYSLGNLGVALFFLLSGFLIMQSMLNWLNKPEPRFAGFFADRVARIMTPYVPALVLIALANLFIATNHSQGGSNTGVLQFIGNFLLLQDHAVFQGLEFAGIDFPWRIRAYNSAEPFWTVAIEMWIYVAMGWFVFCVLKRERIDRWLGGALLAIALPVLIWNAAAGGGKSLTLIWLLGAIAGYLFHVWRANGYPNIRSVSTVIALFGTVALIGRAGKIGFHPYDFQTATLIALVMFGLLGLLMGVKSVPGVLRGSVNFLASYSYSLYLIHNTVLILVLEQVRTEHSWLHIAIAVIAAHGCAYLLYVTFERHYRVVGRWLRPKFERVLAPRGASPISSAAADLVAGGPAAASRQER